MSVSAQGIAARLAGLDDVGRGPTGYRRLAWTPEDRAAGEWFERQAADVGLAVDRDEAGNLWACPPQPGPWWAVGSHLDTVRDGGRYDGALGVAAAFEIAAHARRPPAVISFADEEGARYNTPTFGSRALAGTLDTTDALARRDDDGVAMADAMAACGLDPGGLGAAPRRLERLRGFLEIHIDQTAELHQAGVAAGPVRNLAARLRLAVEIHGAADHAGTTRREERRDALAAAAHMMVAAEALAEPRPGFVVTTARLLVEPNALTTVPSRVRMWIDARAPEPGAVLAWERDLHAAIDDIAARRRVEAQATRASFSEGTAFDGDLLARLAGAAERLGEPVAEVTCFAGHDAGVIAARRPAGMLLVRNAAGVSHAPDEHVELEDAAVAARIVLETLEELS